MVIFVGRSKILLLAMKFDTIKRKVNTRNPISAP